MPRSGNTFMTVDTYCQITFICTGWSISFTNLIRSELSSSSPHPTPPPPVPPSLFFSLSDWHGQMLKHHHLWVLSFFPYIQSIISLWHSPWKNSHTRLSTLCLLTATTLVLVTITFYRGWSNSPLIVLLEPRLFRCPQGAYLQDKYLNEKHLASLKTQAVEYLTVAKE